MTPTAALMHASAGVAIVVVFAAWLPDVVPSSGSAAATHVGETLLTPTAMPAGDLEHEDPQAMARRSRRLEMPQHAEANSTGSVQQWRTSVHVDTAVRRSSSGAGEGTPQPHKRGLSAKRTNGDDKSALIDLCEANRGDWCTSWSADGYTSDPCGDKWAGVRCDSDRFRVTAL